MSSLNFEHHTQFFTSTIYQWKRLLKDDEYKQIIIDSLLFLEKEGSISVNAFVIMPNHLHLIWQIQDGYKADKIPRPRWSSPSQAVVRSCDQQRSRAT
jgi:hypothetical protein